MFLTTIILINNKIDVANKIDVFDKEFVLLQNTTLSVYQKQGLQKDQKSKLTDLAIQSILFGKFKTEERDETAGYYYLYKKLYSTRC